MRTVRNHYEILGVPRSATAAQIKRKYREMVRKFHPDVAKDKTTAHRLFLQINQSYEVLSNPSRRKAYDETLDLDAQMAAGRASQASRSSSTTQQQSRPRQQPVGTVAQLLKDAQFAFIQRRLNEARQLCQEALKIEPRNARACAMVADIYRAQGKRDAAIKYYNLALQFNPSDRESEKKLIGLVDRQVVSQKTLRFTASASLSVNVNAFWWSVVFLSLLLIRVYPGEPIPWLNTYIPRVNLWSWNLVVFLSVASAVGGAMLSLNGLLRHPDEELVFDNSGASWAIVPVGLILLIGSGFFFLGVAAFYTVVAALQGNLSRSVLTVFAFVGLVVGIAAMAYVPAATIQVLLFGGNVAFLSSLFGWYTGAALKPLGAE